jgi:hypothetical protein
VGAGANSLGASSFFRSIFVLAAVCGLLILSAGRSATTLGDRGENITRLQEAKLATK